MRAQADGPTRPELAAMLRSARENHIRSQTTARRRLALATLAFVASSTAIFASEVGVFHHDRPGRPFLTTPRGVVAPRPDQWSPEESRMRALRSSALVVGSSLVLASGALAQDAVQWRVADGGNGHWYLAKNIAPGSSWSTARSLAIAEGGHLATFTTMAEFEWVVAACAGDPSLWENDYGPFLGGIQDPKGLEPLGGWSWITGEPWFPIWGPNDCGADNWGEGDALGLARCGPSDPIAFSDAGIDTPGYGSAGSNHASVVIEWSADCNNDGIVDLGQIRAGDLVDANANNIPDCCDDGVACPPVPLQWRVEDGGNGHWYKAVLLGGTVDWGAARSMAEAAGAHLATVTSTAEFSWIVTAPGADARLWNDTRGPYIGGEQLVPGRLDGWRWVTGEPWFPLWGAGDCGADDFCNADALTLARCNSLSDIAFNDWPKVNTTCANYSILGAIFEWSADCNADGVLDFSQIRAGDIADANGNFIPDCCESAPFCNCFADVDGTGTVNGVDLAAILNSWGTNGGKYPGADVNRDGLVDGADLAEVLNSWGPCQ